MHRVTSKRQVAAAKRKCGMRCAHGQGAEVLVGLKNNVTADQFRRAITEGTAEDCFVITRIEAGDAIFVPAGTAHTIGPGLLLCEIQQHSDLTYRVYDYNRRDAAGQTRPLHLEKALEVIRFGEQRGGKIQPLRIERDGIAKTYLAMCRYFATEKWEFSGRLAAATSRAHFDLLIFLEGSGNLRWSGEHTPYGPAQVWLLPAALGAYEIDPTVQTSLLRTYVPSDQTEFTRDLNEQGVKESEWSALVYP